MDGKTTRLTKKLLDLASHRSKDSASEAKIDRLI